MRDSNLEAVRHLLGIDLEAHEVQYPDEVELVSTAVAEWLMSKGSQRHAAALEVINFIVPRGAELTVPMAETSDSPSDPAG